MQNYPLGDKIFSKLVIFAPHNKLDVRIIEHTSMSLVAIVGRPNVGKSTFFNRLVGMRQAIVDSTAGTTRDRHYGKTDWNGREFSLIDTGGYSVGSDDEFEEEIRKQGLCAEEKVHHALQKIIKCMENAEKEANLEGKLLENLTIEEIYVYCKKSAMRL